MSRSKINPQFQQYIEHFGHNIVVAFYGKDRIKKDAVEVAIECEDCNCVLTSEYKYIGAEVVTG